jgi:hypothetical protein
MMFSNKPGPVHQAHFLLDSRVNRANRYLILGKPFQFSHQTVTAFFACETARPQPAYFDTEQFP